MNYKSFLMRGRIAGVLAVAFAFLLCFSRAFAETPVGLKAQGVSVSYAVANALHLDVRDALGRPVSPSLIQKELKVSEARGRARTSFFSSLPKARAISFFIECVWKLPIFSWGASLFKAGARVWALPVSKKRSLLARRLLLGWLPIFSGVFLISCLISFHREVSYLDFSVLRC